DRVRRRAGALRPRLRRRAGGPLRRAGRQRLPRPGARGRHRASRPRAGRLRARGLRRAPRRLRRLTLSLDLALLRAARTVAHTPARERAVERFSRLGEHAAIWLAMGAQAWISAPEEERPRWRAATLTVAGAYV